MSNYCTAKHIDSPEGCYNYRDHTGQHTGYSRGKLGEFHWTDVPESRSQTTFTRGELALLATLVRTGGYSKHYPGLDDKIHALWDEALKE